MSRSVTHVVVTDNFAGVERYVTTVARETAARGWEVRVVGGRERPMRALLPDSVEWTAGSSMPAALNALWRHPSDVVHAHMTKAEIVAALNPRRSVLVTTRHFAAPRGRNRVVAAATDVLARRLDLEIAISETVRAAAASPGMRVLLNAVPIPAADRQPEPTVVVAQRWESEKRTVDAVRAFEHSGIASSGWRLVLHGSGSQEGLLRDAASTSDARDAIDVAGFADDMGDVLARAGIVLATADHEPFGLLVAEAMAAGAPVVATGSGGHLESVGRVTGARLYEPGDARAAGTHLRVLADMPTHERETYGAALREWAATNLSVSRHVDELLAIYDTERRTK